MKLYPLFKLSILILAVAVLTGCTQNESAKSPAISFAVQDSTDILYSIQGGLQGPESVRFDPAQGVWFISNFNGGGNEEDANGFITRADSTGTITDLKFMTAGEPNPLHAPRGMDIIGNELYVADIKGVHVFNTINGEHLNFIDMESFDPGFLNDISATSPDEIYVTDTGKSAVFLIREGTAELLADSLTAAPNGITQATGENSFLLAPWGGAQEFTSLTPDGNSTTVFESEGGYFDGIEPWFDGYLITSQQDSTLRYLSADHPSEILIHTPGRGADLGVNAELNHIAIPYIALNRVDIWAIDIIE